MADMFQRIEEDAVSIFLVIIFIAALFAAVPLFMRGVYVAAIGVIVLAFVMIGLIAARDPFQEQVDQDVNNYVSGGG
jgi:hypothetical protein